MNVVVIVSVAMLATAGALCLAAVFRGRTLADRAVGVDSVVGVIVCGLAAGGVATGKGLFADLALVLGVLAFLASSTIARYIESRRP